MTVIRVLVVSNHPSARHDLARFLAEQQDITVVGEEARADDLKQRVVNAQPDVVVFDFRKDRAVAFAAIRSVRQANQNTGVIVLSAQNGDRTITEALKSGADGFIPKPEAPSEVARAIRVVQSGEAYLHPLASACLIKSIRAASKARAILRVLSKREREVLLWTAKGYNSREIAEMLSISHKTVETYQSRLRNKLHLIHKAQLVELASQAGMLDPQQATSARHPSADSGGPAAHKSIGSPTQGESPSHRTVEDRYAHL